MTKTTYPSFLPWGSRVLACGRQEFVIDIWIAVSFPRADGTWSDQEDAESVLRSQPWQNQWADAFEACLSFQRRKSAVWALGIDRKPGDSSQHLGPHIQGTPLSSYLSALLWGFSNWCWTWTSHNIAFFTQTWICSGNMSSFRIVWIWKESVS